MQLTYGAADAFNALLYGETNPQTTSFLANQIERAKSLFVGAGHAFIDRAQQAFHHYNSSDALRFARKAIASVSHVVETPRIMELGTLQQMQQASSLMQRWMMANPVARELYEAQRCDGYADTYIDMEPGRFGDAHYDYRRVNQGILVFDEHDGGWSAPQYCDELLEGDRELILEEQVAILRSWDAMNILLAMSKEDPTSPIGGTL